MPNSIRCLHCKFAQKAVTLLSLTLLASAANAALVSFDSITASWINLNPSSIIAEGNGTDSAAIAWGNPISGTAQSGYRFDTIAPTVLEVPPSPSTQFELGTLTHQNIRINGAGLSSVGLALTASIAIDGSFIGERTFLIDLFHQETPNSSAACANGEANGVGVNINGCADIVTFALNETTERFQVGEDFYRLSVLGFQVDSVLAPEFQTIEDQSNAATLVAQIEVDTRAVPEPTSLILIGFGLLGLSIGRRRWSFHS